MLGDVGWPELLIVLLVAVLLFGGTRLAGVGKASGRAIREFKEQTADLREPKRAEPGTESRRVTETRRVGDPVQTTVVETERTYEARPRLVTPVPSPSGAGASTRRG